MSEFKSWRSYDDFARKVRHCRRFIFDDETREFLSSLIATIEQDQEVILSKGDCLLRARIDHGWRPDKNINDDVPAPMPLKDMKPYEGMQTEGRANPKGMPYLYMSKSLEAVIGEVRPWVGAYVTVARFEVKRR